MDWKLEVVIVPVTDVDRAKEFYADKLGFPVDTDHRAGDDFRVVQVTPPGSGCSIVFGKGVGAGTPGSVKGNHLVVADIEAAAAHLDANGVRHSGIQHFENGGMAPGPDPQGQDYASFIYFDDPDGNTWAVQHVKNR
ncbi:glyoxalase superfamily protein [Saccharothrix obliqua]|uniref:glyoxalase superfamily protein n=1 Tax=Saccharothrix obliqua TaxID=2861747 RepID=UPI001C5E0716|nr:glyoxalase superfamily protein [Saccharothrix obliqua]MBW4719089.1 VOC family protein [Saccharothrix obliqua]